MTFFWITLCTLFLGGCTPSFNHFRQSGAAVEELRKEVVELKDSFYEVDLELKLLAERVNASENEDQLLEKGEGISDVRQKIASLEKRLSKIQSDIGSLMIHVNQTSSSLSLHQKQLSSIGYKIDEISKLRSILSKLSSTASSEHTSSSYHVKSGDSLEKIARRYRTSVAALKKQNDLSSDKIIVGQLLSVPPLPQ